MSIDFKYTYFTKILIKKTVFPLFSLCTFTDLVILGVICTYKYKNLILILKGPMLKLKNLHKQLIFPLILILFFLLSVLFLFKYKQDDRRFRTMTSEIFKQEMLGNTLNMHYTIFVPSNFGIYSYQPTLPTCSWKTILKIVP